MDNPNNLLAQIERMRSDHSKMLYIINDMFQNENINEEQKVKLKYLVCLDDRNLLNILKRNYESEQDLKDSIIEIADSIDRNDLEELIKESKDILNRQETGSDDTAPDDIGGSPTGEFLLKRKKEVDSHKKDLKDFHIGGTATEAQKCDLGLSPNLDKKK